MNEKDLEFGELNLDEIMKEFGGSEEVDFQVPEDQPDFPEADMLMETPQEEPELQPEEPAEPEAPVAFEEPATPEEPEQVEDDTVRLDDLSKITGTTPSVGAPLDEKTEPFEAIREDADTARSKVPTPIVFRPKQRLRELKRELIAGPERRYYELAEKGVGKLQLAMLVCLVVVLACAGSGALYAAGLVPENRMRLMVFAQVLTMLIGGLMGCQLMIEGVSDLFHGRFTMNMLLLISFLASGADAYFCLRDLRVPICAAFTLAVMLALWAEYHRRTTEMGQMDTMRKASRLDSLVKCQDYLDGKDAYLRGEGKVADFMEHYNEVSRPERIQNIFAFVALLGSAGVAALAFVFHGLSLAVQIFSTTLLVAVPASFFITVTRPMSMLERRLHRLGTVLCGWQGIKGLRGKVQFPLKDEDIFPAGSGKMNGVKFYGKRAPEVVIAYAAALMKANGGGLAPTFDQLLTSRAGIRHEAHNLRFYGNGGIGGEVCEEPVLMGSLDFMKEMGIEIPEEVTVKQAVYVAIDGELSGLFAISYSRTKYTASGLATICGNRKLSPVILAEDFMVTAPFLKEKFGVRTKRMAFPERQVREELVAKQPEEGTAALALTTQEGLAPAAYAITGARAVRTAWSLGLMIHILGGILGLVIMAALAYLGSTELLTPLNILAYQMIWLVPGLLVTFWPGTI